MLVGDCQDCLILEELGIAASQRRVCLYSYAMLPAEIDSLAFPKERMDLELVDSWLDS